MEAPSTVVGINKQKTTSAHAQARCAATKLQILHAALNAGCPSFFNWPPGPGLREAWGPLQLAQPWRQTWTAAHAARAVSADWVERTAALQPATLADAPADCAECSICIEPLFCGEGARAAEAEAEPVCKVLCGHLFHRRCITEWLKHDLRCPNCRFDLLHREHT